MWMVRILLVLRGELGPMRALLIRPETHRRDTFKIRANQDHFPSEGHIGFDNKPFENGLHLSDCSPDVLRARDNSQDTKHDFFN